MSNKTVKREIIKEYIKSGCQLQQFPTIKMHLFNHIQILDLSNNKISSLPDLTIHNKTSHHALASLKIVNLSKNQFKTVASLEPLAQTATNLISLNIEGNPLVNNLNFIYQLAIIFTNISSIYCGFQVNIQSQVREEMISQQKIGGRIIGQFLQLVKFKTHHLKLLNLQEEVSRIGKILQEFQQPLFQITDKNRRIFQQIDSFINQLTPSSSIQQTYRSPQRKIYHNPKRKQIEIMSEYQITKQSPNLIKYLTQSEQKQINLNIFYYTQLVYKKPIFAKILQQIQVTDQLQGQLQKGNLQAITLEDLLAMINKKWKDNMILTSNYECKLDHHGSYSPFKSIQTDMTSRIQPNINIHHLDHEQIYFSLDKEWTGETQEYIKHRLKSLLRKIVQYQQNASRSHIYKFQSYINSSSDIRNQENQTNYQTFGKFHLEEYVKSSQIKIVSPKSKNKFIVGSLVNILEQVIKKIVLRKISQTKIIKQQNIIFLFFLISSFIKREQQSAFRKLFKASVFYQCLQAKMNKFKTQKIFKAWKQLKKRKYKLLKTILNRKNKKQKAFLSVFLTQFRIHSRNIGLQQRILSYKSQFQKQSYSIADVSSILKRSATLKPKNRQIAQKILVKKSYSKNLTIKK